MLRLWCGLDDGDEADMKEDELEVISSVMVRWCGSLIHHIQILPQCYQRSCSFCAYWYRISCHWLISMFPYWHIICCDLPSPPLLRMAWGPSSDVRHLVDGVDLRCVERALRKGSRWGPIWRWSGSCGKQATLTPPHGRPWPRCKSVVALGASARPGGLHLAKVVKHGKAARPDVPLNLKIWTTLLLPVCVLLPLDDALLPLLPYPSQLSCSSLLLLLDEVGHAIYFVCYGVSISTYDNSVSVYTCVCTKV